MTLPEDVVLASFTVLARFRREGEPDDDLALAGLERQLEGLGLSEAVRVERREPDGSVLLEARFAVVSTEPHNAVTGVLETLRDGGLEVDEVWAQP